LKNVPLKGLQAFEAVGRCSSVTSSAQELGVSPGAISQQIRKIEQYLGVALFERNGRHLELTSLGRLYHNEIVKVFKQLAAAGDVLHRARNKDAIVLSGLSSVVNNWIGRRIFDWQAMFSGVPVKLIGQDNEPRLGDDGIDFRITYGEASASQHTHYMELFRDWVVPACSPRLIRQTIAQPSDIFHYPLLNIEWERRFGSSPSWHDFSSKCGINDNALPSGLAFTLSTSAIDAAASSRGFVLAQLSLVSEELRTGALIIPIDIRMPLKESYYLAWDHSSLQKPFGPKFKRWILKIAKEQALAAHAPLALAGV